MVLERKIQELVDKIEGNNLIQLNEESTKNALIMPMLAALGYDIFNPSEVKPEFSADTPGRNAEKVDYALFLNGTLNVLVECKPLRSPLDVKQAKQLFRYFSSTDARLAILTDGETYKFFTDVDAPNRMDEEPFLIINISQFSLHDLKQLEKFEKSSFDINVIVSSAEDLKYRSLVKRELVKELEKPSDEFVKLLASRVYKGNITAGIKEKFGTIVKSAADLMIRENVNRRLRDAMQVAPPEDVETEEVTDEIVTTDTEIRGFHIVQAIAAQIVDPGRVFYRDAKSYCAVLLDNKNTKTICRLHFNNESRLRIGTFVDKVETKHELDSERSIYALSNLILDRIKQMS